jgi:acetoacetate decarboxylase
MNDINSGAGEKSNRLAKKEVLARAYAMPFASPAYTAAPSHTICDVTLPCGKVVHDYLA